MDTQNQPAITSATDLLKQWWESKSFEGKEFCSLDESGQLTVSPFPAKIVSTLNHITGDAVLQTLQDKYRELKKLTEELIKEWSETDDKIKMMSKVNRLKEYISTANAVGNLESLLVPVKEYEAVINGIVDENFKAKQALVTEAESLTIENNNWKDLTQKFKDITEKWKQLGFVDKKRNEQLWDKLEALKSKFFEDKRSHHEDIEHEMLQNLDLKMEIVEKAEANTNSENWKETTEFFKQLLEEWKNTGRTIPEKNEALWQRFIGAKNNFFDRKKLHTDQIKIEQEANYEKKLAIIEKAETIKNSTEWSITTKAFNDLMDEWKAIGPVPAEHNTSLWERFSAAKETFYGAKRSQADAYKTMLDENYQKKTAIIERAESLKNSSNWREVSDEMNLLFEQWKQIGHVGKEHSEKLWEQFISARKHFFNRKDQDRNRRKEQYEKNKEVQHIQTKNFLATLEHETADETAQIAEFRESLENIGEGPKSEEIKSHLTNLISELEQKIKNRAPKIADLKGQVARLDQVENTEAPVQNHSEA